MGQNKKPGHHNGRSQAQKSTFEIECLWAGWEAPVCRPSQDLRPRTRGETPSRMNPAVALAGFWSERKTNSESCGQASGCTDMISLNLTTAPWGRGSSLQFTSQEAA